MDHESGQNAVNMRKGIERPLQPSTVNQRAWPLGECEKPVALASKAALLTFQPAVVSPGESRNLGVLAISTRMRKAASQPKRERVSIRNVWLGEWNSNQRRFG